MSKMEIYWIILTSILFIQIRAEKENCAKDQYDICVRIADPLVKEAHLVVPDNLDDIDLVCRIWNRFVDCLRRYTDHCFNDQEKQRFNNAVESPIESVHQMCMQPNYQKEYLKHAPCIKSIIIERAHCGLHYNLLVDEAEKDNFDSKSTLCCSHDRFRQCVQRETRKMCDKGVRNGAAAKFAIQIIDKALRFLEEQCINYIPNSGDCQIPQEIDPSTISSHTLRSDSTSHVSTASSEIYPWSTSQQQEANYKDISPLRSIPKTIVTTTSTNNNWLPSSSSTNSPSTVDNNWRNSIIPSSSALPARNLGSRNRPSSYGRSKSWTTSSEPPSSSTNIIWSSPTDTSTKPDIIYPDQLSTVASWKSFGGVNKYGGSNLYDPSSYKSTTEQSRTSNPTIKSSLWNTPSTIYSTTSETWYPAAGNQLTNEVDEPNQLGLTKPQNSRASLMIFNTQTYCLWINVWLGVIIWLQTFIL